MTTTSAYIDFVPLDLAIEALGYMVKLRGPRMGLGRRFGSKALRRRIIMKKSRRKNFGAKKFFPRGAPPEKLVFHQKNFLKVDFGHE